MTQERFVWRARRDDPPESHAAAEHVERTGLAAAQASVVWNVVRANSGMTARELSTVGEKLDHAVIHKRLPELAHKGLIRKGRARKCNVSGRTAATWWMS